MANPNKVARGSGSSQAAREGRDRRFAQDPMVMDMAKVQNGEMSPEEFMAKWNK